MGFPIYRILISPKVSPLLWGRPYVPAHEIAPDTVSFWTHSRYHYSMDEAFLDLFAPESEAALAYYLADTTRLEGLGADGAELIRAATVAWDAIEWLEWERGGLDRMAARVKPSYVPKHPTILAYEDLDAFLYQLPRSLHLTASEKEPIVTAWRRALEAAEALSQAEDAIVTRDV